MNGCENNIDKLKKEGIEIKPINFNELRIKFPSKDFEEEFRDGSGKFLSSVKYNEIEVLEGSIFTIDIGTQVLKYKANNIMCKNRNENTFSIFDSLYNKATIFILPLIFNKIKLSSYIHYSDKRYVGFLINAYIECNFIEKKDIYSIFVMLKFSKSEKFKKTEESFRENLNYIRTFDISKDYVLYEFTIPEIFRVDFMEIIDGNYSKIGKHSKKRILNFYGESIDGFYPRSVIERDPSLVKQLETELDVSMIGIELCSKFNESEILTKNMI